MITPSSVPLNIEYKGESDVGLSLYKLPRIDGSFPKIVHDDQNGNVHKTTSMFLDIV